MCGIFGITSSHALTIDPERFESAVHLQTHRGPDDFGIHIGRFHALGHRRLSIIDLDKRAAQPMQTEDGRFFVIFNGEIYNYLEIRNELQSHGFRFSTQSDTEVLLFAYRHWGRECLEKLMGMFAFAVVDTQKNITFLARDRLGIKPLYYTLHKGCLYFSSEIKSILSVLDTSPEMNHEAVFSYLSYRYPIGGRTFFKGIHSLDPGHYLEFKEGMIRTYQWWDCAQYFEYQSNDLGENAYLERLLELLESSVRYRMIADVPVGAYLSGGVDSSLVTALMARQSHTRVNTYSVRFQEKMYDESAFAREVAEMVRTNHHEIFVDCDRYLEDMENLIGIKDAPLAVPNEVPLGLMSRELKKHTTVILSGEGADELFGGYGRIFRSVDDYARMQAVVNGEYSEEDSRQLVAQFKAKYGQAHFATPFEHFLSKYEYMPRSMQASLLSPEAMEFGENAQGDQLFPELFSRAGDSYFNQLTYAFIKVHLVGLLHRLDSSTMAHSVEARVPFVDHRLVEFACALPRHYKLRWRSSSAKSKARLLNADEISEQYDIPKYILKRAASGYIPDSVIQRKKQGFPVPLDNWINKDFQVFAKDILLSSSARQRGFYNTAEIDRRFAAMDRSTSHSEALRIWMLVNLELFLLNYF